MLVETETRVITRLATGKESGFGIQDNAVAFAILSDKIYRDKIRAVIREIACNAYDSHIEADCEDKPIWIHLPNALEPFFSVRDEGIGMSDETIHTHFQTYFDSSKRNSAKLIGKWGLGSKSPFAYTDMFTLIACFDGVQSTYAAYRSEEGRPHITLMSQNINSGLPNGVEVSINVTNRSDDSEFARLAYKVLRHFPTRPTVTGKTNFWDSNPNETVHATGDNWKAFDGSGNSIVMGNVAYPIDSSSVYRLTEKARHVLTQMHLEITVPMGAVDFTPSREDLSYNDRTLASLEAIGLKVHADLLETANIEMEAAPTEWEARKVFKRFWSINSHLFRKLTWNNTVIESEILHYIVRKPKVSSIAIVIDGDDDDVTEGVSDRLPPVAILKFNTQYRSQAIERNISRTVYETVNNSNYSTIIFDDLKRGGERRVKHFLKNKRGHNSAFLIINATPEEQAALIETFPENTFKKSSELDKVPGIKVDKLSRNYQPRGVSVLKTERIDNSRNGLCKDHWDEVHNIDLNEDDIEIIYVVKAGYQIDVSHYQIADSVSCGILNKDVVIGLTEKRLERLRLRGEAITLTPLRDYLARRFKAIYLDTGLFSFLKAENEGGYDYNFIASNMRKRQLPGLDNHHPINEIYREMTLHTQSRNGYHAIAGLASYLNIDLPKSVVGVVAANYASLYAKYPLYFSTLGATICLKHLEGYVKWVDDSTKL